MITRDPSPHGPPGTRVLLVDSRPILLSGLTDLLAQHGPRLQVVGQASSYARALELAHHLRPEVVLLSVFQDGIDLLDVIAALVRFSRVLVLKGMHDPVPVSTVLALGAAGVVIAEQPAETVVQALLQASTPGVNGKVWIHAAPGGHGMGRPPRRPFDELQGRLTARERELVCTVVANPGAKYLVIAAKLGISEHTVHNHLSNIYQKLNVVNRSDLLVYAVRHGLGDEAAGAFSGK